MSEAILRIPTPEPCYVCPTPIKSYCAGLNRRVLAGEYTESRHPDCPLEIKKKSYKAIYRFEVPRQCDEKCPLLDYRKHPWVSGLEVYWCRGMGHETTAFTGYRFTQCPLEFESEVSVKKEELRWKKTVLIERDCQIVILTCPECDASYSERIGIHNYCGGCGKRLKPLDESEERKESET